MPWTRVVLPPLEGLLYGPALLWFVKTLVVGYAIITGSCLLTPALGNYVLCLCSQHEAFCPITGIGVYQQVMWLG